LEDFEATWDRGYGSVLITGTWAKFSNGLLGRIRLTKSQRLKLQVAVKAWHADSANLGHVHWSDGAGSWTRQDVSGINKRLCQTALLHPARIFLGCQLGSSMCEAPLGGGRMAGAWSPIKITAENRCSSLASGQITPQRNLPACVPPAEALCARIEGPSTDNVSRRGTHSKPNGFNPYTKNAGVRNAPHFSHTLVVDSPRNLMGNKHSYAGNTNLSRRGAINSNVTCSVSPPLLATTSGSLFDPNTAVVFSGAGSEAGSCPIMSHRRGGAGSRSNPQLPSIQFVFHANKYEKFDGRMTGSTQYVPAIACMGFWRDGATRNVYVSDRGGKLVRAQNALDNLMVH